MNKPNFRPIAPLDVDDDGLERINDRLRVPTMVRPPAKAAETASRHAAKAAAEADSPDSRLPHRCSQAQSA